MDERSTSESAVYEIRVKGLLEERWTHWFDGMTITPDPDKRETVLTGTVTDQAALHGVLARIRDLGLTLLALYRVGEHPQ